MAFISSSPPPMMPDDDFIEEDVDEFGHLDEDEDEDSAAFDLTGKQNSSTSTFDLIQQVPDFILGMSAKLQSIPKETIQVAPKEVVLPTNGVIDFDESLKPPEVDDLPSDNSSQDLDLELKDESENLEAKVDVEVTEQNEVVDYTEVEQSNHEQTDLCKEEEFENQEKEIVSISPSTSPVQDTTKEPSEPDEKSPDPDPPVQEDSFETPLETEAFEANFSDSPVPGPDSPVFNHPKVDYCDDQAEDDFGDFAEVPPLQLDDNDSDFGDFEEESKKDEFASASGWASLDTSPRGKLDQILIGLQLKLSSVISTLFSVVLDNSPNEEIFDSVIPMLDLAKEDCQDDSVWLKIHNIQSTPALNQKWKDTLSRQKLLTLLNIDPKNVVSLVNIWVFASQGFFLKRH